MTRCDNLTPFGDSTLGESFPILAAMSETTPELRDIAIEHLAVQTSTLGRMRVLQTVADLADQLLNDWPDDPGEKHLKARLACIDALEGKLSAGACRIAFLEAAAEDGVWTMAPNRPDGLEGRPRHQAWHKKRSPWRRGRPKS